MEGRSTYLEKPGKENTQQVLSLVKETAVARGKTVLTSYEVTSRGVLWKVLKEWIWDSWSCPRPMVLAKAFFSAGI